MMGLIFEKGMTFLSGTAILNMLEIKYESDYSCRSLDRSIMKFKKRIYKNLKDFSSDLWFPLRNHSRLREISRKKLVSPSFRERLMLTVTTVNGCRYCSYFHTRQALKSGVSQEQISQLLSGDMTCIPEDEFIAVIYAQHWAESDANPDPETLKRVQQTYGMEKTEAIHLMLRMIRMGNLLGNSWDYFLYRISFGKLRG
jgi:AhpD family alkylhydroperoxidase